MLISRSITAAADGDNHAVSMRARRLGDRRNVVSGCSTVVRWVDCLPGGSHVVAQPLVQNLFVPKKAKPQDNDADRADAGR